METERGSGPARENQSKGGIRGKCLYLGIKELCMDPLGLKSFIFEMGAIIPT